MTTPFLQCLLELRPRQDAIIRLVYDYKVVTKFLTKNLRYDLG